MAYLLGRADAVLARTCSIEGNGALDESVHKFAHHGDLGPVAHHNSGVEVAVADVSVVSIVAPRKQDSPDDGAVDARLLHLFLARVNELGQR